MNLIFFGSDEYSVVVMRSLLAASCTLSAIITTPPKPEGRSDKIAPNEVESFAIAHNIKVLYYPTNKNKMGNFITDLSSLISPLSSTPTGISASFGRLIAPEVIELFGARGIINIHPSLLPQYRNVAPVPYALALGDTVTGVTIFRIGAGIDNGEILAQVPEPIHATDTSPILLNRLFAKGANLLLQWLSRPSGPGPVVLPNSESIFTRKLNRQSGFVEWPVLLKLINDQPITPAETSNPLLSLRLQLQKNLKPHASSYLLSDLIRALVGYEKVWTIADTRKGKIQISLVYPNRQLTMDNRPSILISGKPKPITWSDFEKYYL